MAYLDDILIYLNNKLKHQVYIKKVLERLQNIGLQVNIKKYKFGVKQTKYLRFIVSIEGIKINPKKVKAIYNQKPPYTIKGIQSFLSFYNFYYCFICNYRVVAKPLIQLTQKNTPFTFNNNCMEAFKEIKDRLISSLILCYYNPDLKLILKTDASNGVIAGILLQLYPDSKQYPIAFFSKTIDPAKYNYKVYNKEILAII